MQDMLSHPVVGMILLLGVLIVIHEAGHFLVGRFFGIGVEIFSIGMGGAIWRRTYKGTEFRVAWFPIGGFVKFAGMLKGEEIAPGVVGTPFYQASRLAKALVLLAGPGANLILAVLLYAGMGMYGKELPAPVIGMVEPHSPAEQAGLQSGDRVLRVGDAPVVTWMDLQTAIVASPKQTLLVEIERHGVHQTLSLTPGAIGGMDAAGHSEPRGQAGVSPGFVDAVVTVVPGSPAAKAGLSTGDRIQWIGDATHSVRSWNEVTRGLQQAMETHSHTLSIGYIPAGKSAGEGQTGTLLLSEGQSLGLQDSQLTVGEMTSTARDVRFGDRLMSLEGHPTADIFALYRFLQENRKKEVQAEVLRGEVFVHAMLHMEPIEIQGLEGPETVYRLPFSFLGAVVQADPILVQYRNPIRALGYGITETYQLAGTMLNGLAGLFTGSVPLRSLGGPLMIAKVAGDSIKAGWMTFLHVLAMVSVNLGILNLFPIPILDGGRLVVLGIETLRRRDLTEESLLLFQKIGLFLVLSLTVVALYNDVSRFWASMAKSLGGGL